MKRDRRSCCFHNCRNEGVIYVGASPTGDHNSEWMCAECDRKWQRCESRKREQREMDNCIAYLDPSWVR